MDERGGLIGMLLIAFGFLGATFGSKTLPERPPTNAQLAARADDTSANLDDRSGILVIADRALRKFGPVRVLFAVHKKYGEDDGAKLAATIAYFGFFSIFPALLAGISIVGFILQGNPELRDKVIDTAVEQVPMVGSAIGEGGLEGSGLALITGLLGAIWGGLSSMEATQRALNVVNGVPWHERTQGAKARIKGISMFGVVGLSFLLSVALTSLVAAIQLPGVGRFGIHLANLLVNFLVILLTFRILTDRKWTLAALVPGALLAGTGFYLLQSLGARLITRYVSNASATYGTFAVVIGLLWWFHLSAQVVLIGAELNAVLADKLYPRALVQDALMAGDYRTLDFHQRAAARHEVAEAANTVTKRKTP